MFVVSMKANKGALVAVAAVGVALAMLLTQCNGATSTANATPSADTPVAAGSETVATFYEQGETNGAIG